MKIRHKSFVPVIRDLSEGILKLKASAEHRFGVSYFTIYAVKDVRPVYKAAGLFKWEPRTKAVLV